MNIGPLKAVICELYLERLWCISFISSDHGFRLLGYCVLLHTYLLADLFYTFIHSYHLGYRFYFWYQNQDEFLNKRQHARRRFRFKVLNTWYQFRGSGKYPKWGCAMYRLSFKYWIWRPFLFLIHCPNIEWASMHICPWGSTAPRYWLKHGLLSHWINV